MSSISTDKSCSNKTEYELPEVTFNGNQIWALEDGFLTDVSFSTKARFGHPCGPMPTTEEHISYNEYRKSVKHWTKYIKHITKYLVLPTNSSAFLRRPINVSDPVQLRRFPKNYLLNSKNHNYLMTLLITENEIPEEPALPQVPSYAKDPSINTLLFTENSWITKIHSQIPDPEIFNTAEEFKEACTRWAYQNSEQMEHQIGFDSVITSNPHFDPKRIDLSLIDVKQNRRKHKYFRYPPQECPNLPMPKHQIIPSSKIKENLKNLLKTSNPEFQPLYIIQDYPNLPQLDINIIPNNGSSIAMAQMPLEVIHQLEKFGTNSQSPILANHLQFLAVSAFAGKPMLIHGINTFDDFVFCLNQVPCSKSSLFHLEVFLALQQYTVQNFSQIRGLLTSDLVLFYNAVSLICEFSDMPVTTVDPLFSLVGEITKPTNFPIMLAFTHRIVFLWEFSTIFAEHFARPEIFEQSLSDNALFLKKVSTEQLVSYMKSSAKDIAQLLADHLNENTAPIFCLILALFMKTRNQVVQLFFDACGARLFTTFAFIAKTIPKQFIKQILPSIRSNEVLPKLFKLFLSNATDPQLLASEFSNEYTLLLAELFGQPPSSIGKISFEFSDALISGLMQFKEENKLLLLSYLCGFLRRCAKEGYGEPNNYIPIAANLVFTIIMSSEAVTPPILIALDSLLRTDSAGVFLGGVSKNLDYLGKFMTDPDVDVECWGCVKTIAVRFPEQFHIALQIESFQECFIEALKSLTPLTALQLFLMINKAVKGSKGQKRLLKLRRDKTVPSLAEDLSTMMKRAHINLARTVRWTEKFLDEEDYYNNIKILKKIHRALKSDSPAAKLFTSK